MVSAHAEDFFHITTCVICKPPKLNLVTSLAET